MSDDRQTWEAYQPPVPVADVVEADAVARPTGRTTAICVIAIVLGGLGLLTALMGILALVFGQRIQSAINTAGAPGMPAEMRQSQEQMQQAMQAIQDRFMVPNTILLTGHVLLASALLFGGIKSLKRSPPGRKVLVAACGAAVGFEILRGVLHSFVQMETMEVTSRYMQQMLGADGPPQAAEMASTVMQAAMIGGLVFWGVIVVIKLVFYIMSYIHLRKPQVVAILDAKPS